MMKTLQYATMFGLACAAIAAPLRAGAHEHISAIYQFDSGGYNPQGGVTFWHGQIYGTAYYGGASKCFANLGCGTIFRLTRAKGGGGFVPEAIYNFQGGTDGGNPDVQLTLGPDGSVYGYDLDFYAGAAFQISPPAGGGLPWTYTRLWNFNRGPSTNPLNIVAAPSGEMFGVLGGYGNGAVFELRP